MTITQRLLELDPSLEIHNEGEWSNSASMYQAFNDAGVECEVGEFLYSMVRLTKPNCVLETGTHWGVSAAYIGLAMKDNGYGHLDTYEFLPENHRIASERIKRMGLENYVACFLQDVGSLDLEHRYQMMFLDTEPQTRFAEAVRFYDSLDEAGFMFIHDLHRHMHQIPNEEHGFAWPYGPVPALLRMMVQSNQLRPFHFSTPRGFTGFYKSSEGDYKWLTSRQKQEHDDQHGK